MIIYRPQRGGFAEAMAEAQEFESIAAMKQALAAQSTWREYGLRGIEADDIVLGEETIEDERNGWHDTREVCVRRFAGRNFTIPYVIGFCATDYPKSQK